MRDFAKIIPLETCDCLAYRDGFRGVTFQFWLRGLPQGDLLAPSVKMDWPLTEVVDALFTEPAYADRLKEKAEKAWAEIQKVIDGMPIEEQSDEDDFEE